MIFVLFPAYNEGKSLPLVLKKVNEILKDFPHEFVIVDDASQDETVLAIKGLKRLNARLLKHQINQGPGAAFDTGFRRILKVAKDSDFVITMESDATSDPKILLRIIQELNRKFFDLVVAGCFVTGGGLGEIPWYRKVMSQSANLMLKIVFPIPRIYTYSGFYRGYRVGILKKVYRKYGNSTITDKGFFSVVELLIKLSMIPGIKMTEVPMVLDWGLGRRKSGMDVGRTIRTYLKYILKYKFYGVS